MKPYKLYLASILAALLISSFSSADGVRGTVMSVQGDFIEIDVGSSSGITGGDSGRVYYTITVVGVERPVYLAKIKITYTSSKTSMARIEDKTGEVKVGHQVEFARKGPVAGEVWKDNYLGMEFVWVDGGCFEMGCGLWAGDCFDDERPVHEVCVNGFWMGKYEVTQGQWERVMGSNPSHFKDGANYPIEQVSWNDAQEFIHILKQKAGKKFRLPTEAEWEYAARSGGKHEKWAGTSSEYELGSKAWYSFNSGSKTHPVGQKRPNGLGLHDMSGNVWEWCQDWYDKDYYRNSPRNNPEGPGGGNFKVFRGGSHINEPSIIRASVRNWFAPSGPHSTIGFRLVVSSK